MREEGEEEDEEEGEQDGGNEHPTALYAGVLEVAFKLVSKELVADVAYECSEHGATEDVARIVDTKVYA